MNMVTFLPGNFGVDSSTFELHDNDVGNDSDSSRDDNLHESYYEKNDNSPTCSFNPCILPQLNLIVCGNPKCTSVLSEKYLHHACQVSYMDAHNLECEGCKKWCCNCLVNFPPNRKNQVQATLHVDN